jgi:RNA polymerase sigma-70 factor (ECF subfamily)
MSDHDEPLVAQFNPNDPDALARYIEENRWRLMAFIERQLGGALRRKVEPDDIFQETSADAVRALPDMDLQGRDPFSWLCQIAERRIVDAHRRFFGAQKRDAAREVSLGQQRAGATTNVGMIDLLVASMTTPSQVSSRNAREARLMEALNQLPNEQRDAIRMRYLENLPSKQIAEKLGKTDASVRVMLTRTLKKLQMILGEIAEN